MPVFERDGVSLSYQTRGEGPPLVLLSSFLCSTEMWRHQVEALSPRHRTLGLDWRGHGRSGPADVPCRLDSLVDDVLAMLDHSGVPRAVWAGLSIGGMVALRAALRVPERVRALILVDTDAGGETVAGRLRYVAMAAVARHLGVGRLRGAIARRMFGSTSLRERQALVSEWSRRFEEVHVPTALRMLDALNAREDLGPRLGSIAMPALVVVGEEDASLPPARSRRIAAGLPQASLVAIPRAGHLSALETPEAVSDAMRAFLERLPATPQ